MSDETVIGMQPKDVSTIDSNVSVRAGTTLEMIAPVMRSGARPSRAMRLRHRTPYSSAVVLGSVANRQWVSSVDPSKIPATTFCAVNRDGEYLGGVIAPGLTISAEALFTRAAKLSKVELARPKTVIGTDTASSIQSGLIFGYAGLVDTLVQRMEREMGRTSYVIATGGLASVIAPEARSIQHVEPYLTLHGLELLYRRARGASLTQWI